MLDMKWKPGSAKDVADYFLAADYYLDEGKGFFGGRYAESLGFHGEVNRNDLIGLLSNRTPLGGKITQRDVGNARRAMEWVFSPPKSFTIMAELSGDNRLYPAFVKSVEATMKYAEQDAMRRVRDGGQNHDKYTGNLVYAIFPQKLSRPTKRLISTTALTPVWMAVPDPQDHAHVLVANATRDPDSGKWYALQADQLLRNQHHYELFFREHLSKQLEKMGYKLDYSKGNFEIHGITREMIEKFSGRHLQINAEADARNVTNPETRSKIARMGREKKTDRFTWEELQQIWIGRLTPTQLQTIRDIYATALGWGPRDAPDFSQKYVDAAVEKLTHQNTWVLERKVMTEALKTGLGKVSVEGIQSHLDYLHSKGQILRRKRDLPELTTKKARDKQIRVEDLWKAGMGRHEKLGRDVYTVKSPKSHLNALPKLYGSRDSFMSMRGNIGRPEAIKQAMGDLGAAKVNNVNALPDTKVWFVEKFNDGDLPELMEKATEQDVRVVFWGDKTPSDLEERLRLDPYFLFDKKETTLPVTRRLKEAVLNLIRRTHDREIERDRRSEKQPEKQWQHR